MDALRPTRAEIELEALRSNFALVKQLARGREVIAVVKADAYGHGAVLVAKTLVEAGCDRLAVVTLEEAIELRSAGIEAPILVLGGIHSFSGAAELANIDAIAVVHRTEQVSWLSRAAIERNIELRCQVEVDSGMSRMGMSFSESSRCAVLIDRAQGLVFDGVYTHFARADEEDQRYSEKQLSVLGKLISELHVSGINPGQVHISNSAGLLSNFPLPEWITAVRPGLVLYGVLPAAHLEGAGKLCPVMTLRTEIALIRSIETGTPVGYSSTYKAPSPRRIATLPIGYADGVPAAAGQNGCVLHRGRRIPMVGRVSMDYVTVDLGDFDAEVGDSITLFGTGLPVEEVAEAVGTIPYELLVRVGQRVPRFPI